MREKCHNPNHWYKVEESRHEILELASGKKNINLEIDAVQEWFSICNEVDYKLKPDWEKDQGPLDIHLDNKYEGLHNEQGESFDFVKQIFMKYYLLHKYTRKSEFDSKLYVIENAKLVLETTKVILTMGFK